ncbi:MAG: PKD domain-containing protein, partial [Anaerolineales bacterium]|nr:PKD domain-containing protein [Anaerolineales bacterium]
TIRVRVGDSNGAAVTGATMVTVNNVAPTIISLTNTGPITEGSSVIITLTATDPGGASDPLTYAFDCNNDGTYEIGPQSGNSTTCFFGDNGVYTVRGRIADSNGGTASAMTEVTVNNASPAILEVSNNSPRLPNQPVTVRVSATDPAGANDPLQYEFDCDGDNVYEIGLQAASTAECVYAAAGTYTVNVRVSDGDGGMATGSTTVSIASVLRLFLPLIVR